MVKQMLRLLVRSGWFWVYLEIMLGTVYVLLTRANNFWTAYLLMVALAMVVTQTLDLAEEKFREAEQEERMRLWRGEDVQ